MNYILSLNCMSFYCMIWLFIYSFKFFLFVCLKLSKLLLYNFTNFSFVIYIFIYILWRKFVFFIVTCEGVARYCLVQSRDDFVQLQLDLESVLGAEEV